MQILHLQTKFEITENPVWYEWNSLPNVQEFGDCVNSDMLRFLELSAGLFQNSPNIFKRLTLDFVKILHNPIQEIIEIACCDPFYAWLLYAMVSSVGSAVFDPLMAIVPLSG